MVCKGLYNGFQLKMAMLVLMVFDHIYYYFSAADELAFMHLLARLVAPVFAYMTAQAMIYTRDRVRYILRLFSFAAIMAIGNTVLTHITGIVIPNNIFLSLALGASLVYCIEQLKSGGNRPLYIILTAAAILSTPFCEGQYIIPMITVIFYFFRNNKPLMYTIYVLSTGIPFLLAYAFTGQLQVQFYMIFAVILFMFYNGKRGPDTAFAKYFFYIFYALHIWAIVLFLFLRY